MLPLHHAGLLGRPPNIFYTIIVCYIHSIPLFQGGAFSSPPHAGRWEHQRLLFLQKKADMRFLIFALILAHVLSDCKTHKDCSEDKPICDSGVCVQCVYTKNCPIDAYCDDSKCVPYKSSETGGHAIISSFCNYYKTGVDDCTDVAEYAYCGFCRDVTVEDPPVLEGSCVDFECQLCNAQNPKSGVGAQHPEASCYRKGLSATNGQPKLSEYSDGTFSSFPQDSSSYLMFGVFLFSILYLIISVAMLLLVR